jgi:hypothetical protein
MLNLMGVYTPFYTVFCFCAGVFLPQTFKNPVNRRKSVKLFVQIKPDRGHDRSYSPFKT